MPDFSYDTCPVCKSIIFKKIGKIEDTLNNGLQPHNSEIVKCSNCDLIFVNPLPIWDNNDFATLYNEKYFNLEKNPGKGKWLKIREHKNIYERFNRINKYLKSEKNSLLEIGSGIYAFMCKSLLQKGWDVTAQEPSKKLSEQLQHYYPDMKVITEDYLTLDEHTRYSLIYADSVFEHVHNPGEYITKSASLLEAGGILYFISPNEHSLLNYLVTLINRLRGKSVHYLSPYKSPYHLIGFSKKSLEILASESGLQLIAYIKRYDYIWFHILERKKNPLKYPVALLFYLIDRCGWGANLEIILKKV